MEDEKYHEWLDNLKSGDRVAVFNSYFGNKSYDIKNVAKITPTGMIKLENGDIYTKEGYIRSGDRFRTRSILRPLTKEVVDTINIKYIKSKINFQGMVDKLSFEQLKTLLLWQEEIEKNMIQ